MIFVTLGSQKFQFDRLLKEIDNLIKCEIIKEDVFAQTGYSEYVPENYSYKNCLDRDEFAQYQEDCSFEITHAGTGAIIGALKKGKKVIAVPRLAVYGEHVDDHQIQIIEQFKELNLIYGVSDCSELKEAVQKIKDINFNTYVSNTQRYIDDITCYIEGLNK